MNKYLTYHINKYPKMQIEDKIKLLMQGFLGPGHLVNDYQMVLNRVESELNQISISSTDIYEEISDTFVRVYLKPYYEKHHSFDELIKAFILSSKEEKDFDGFFKELENLRKTLNEDELNFLNIYLENKKYLISHSDIYRNLYNPHYLVISKKYIDGGM